MKTKMAKKTIISTKQVRHYYLEWKHPETRKWVTIYTPVPSTSQKALEQEIKDDIFSLLSSLSSWNNEFERLSSLSTEWRSAIDEPYEMVLTRLENGELEFYYSDPVYKNQREKMNLQNCDELLFDRVVSGIFNKNWITNDIEV